MSRTVKTAQIVLSFVGHWVHEKMQPESCLRIIIGGFSCPQTLTGKEHAKAEPGCSHTRKAVESFTCRTVNS